MSSKNVVQKCVHINQLLFQFQSFFLYFVFRFVAESTRMAKRQFWNMRMMYYNQRLWMAYNKHYPIIKLLFPIEMNKRINFSFDDEYECTQHTAHRPIAVNPFMHWKSLANESRRNRKLLEIHSFIHSVHVIRHHTVCLSACLSFIIIIINIIIIWVVPLSRLIITFDLYLKTLNVKLHYGSVAICSGKMY